MHKYIQNWGQEAGGCVCTAMGVVIDQWNQILSLICMIVGMLSVVIPFAIKIIRWIKNAFKDGKIDEHEIRDLGSLCDEGKDIYNEVKDKLNK